MGRIRGYIKINGKKYWTMFDSGAENTYVRDELGEILGKRPLKKTFITNLGGKKNKIFYKCDIAGYLEGKFIDVEAYVLDSIGYDKKAKREIDILFGAYAMQKWGIVLDLKKEKVDLSRYPSEFVEYLIQVIC